MYGFYKKGRDHPIEWEVLKRGQVMSTQILKVREETKHYGTLDTRKVLHVV